MITIANFAQFVAFHMLKLCTLPTYKTLIKRLSTLHFQNRKQSKLYANDIFSYSKHLNKKIILSVNA